MLKEITIQLRVDFDGEEKTEIIINSARIAAKHLFTTATLIADKRKPQIMLQCGDMFEGAKEIDLADDMPDDAHSQEILGGNDEN